MFSSEQLVSLRSLTFTQPKTGPYKQRERRAHVDNIKTDPYMNINSMEDRHSGALMLAKTLQKLEKALWKWPLGCPYGRYTMMMLFQWTKCNKVPYYLLYAPRHTTSAFSQCSPLPLKHPEPATEDRNTEASMEWGYIEEPMSNGWLSSAAEKQRFHVSSCRLMWKKWGWVDS